MGTDSRRAYADREAEHATRLEGARRRGERLARGRVAVFVAGVGALVLWDVLEGAAAWGALVAAAALVAVFVWLVVVHARVRAEERRHEAMLTLVREGLARLDRAWDRIPGWPEGPPVAPRADHPYAGDLDLFGRASLAALCGPVTTAPGRATLSSWLLEAAPPAERAARQEAVRELAPALDARLAFASLARRKEPPGQAATEALLRWAESPPRLLERPAITAALWGLPALFLATVALDLIAPAAPPLWILSVAANLFVLRRLGPTVHAELERAEESAPALQRYAEQIALARTWPMEAPRLAALLGRLGGALRPGAPADPASANGRLRRLSRILDTAASSHNAIQQLLSILVLFDLHVHRALERWKVESGPELRGWLTGLGELEALAALACVAHDHPDWSFPVPAPGSRLTARALGHPLLRPEAVVRNDVEVGPAGTFLLVTGSNMSGKSTLLRAVAANVVLGSAGGPVCAGALALPAVSLHTTIRVQDSLEGGVSLFMAELKALARIVKAAREGKAAGRPVLYLLDEVLHGTNSGDRRVAARTVIRHLLDADAIGAVTTHDLSLAEAPDLSARAEAVHFSEEARAGEDGPRLAFDYRLKLGLATTKNALILLEMVGLGPVREE